MHATTITAAFRFACETEIAALKPGNVHAYAPGHGMTHTDFLHSAEVAAPALCRAGAGLGERILQAVTETRAAVGQNTNLGILLLCAPLAMAAEAGGEFRASLRMVLAAADIADADAVFRAIVLASPGGLGEAPRHDVRRAATVTLHSAMTEAADRDSIAQQYVDEFSEIFGIGCPAYAAALARGWTSPWAAVAVHLAFLARIPDSHVRRKYGPATATALQQEAAPWHARLAAAGDPESLVPDLLAWDAHLKQRGLNPGTTADLTVASIFAHTLRGVLRPADMDG